MAGLGIAFLGEMADKSIRRATDLLSIADGALVIAIPYIPTHLELRRRRRTLVLIAAVVIFALASAATAAYLFMPAPELLLAKIRALMSR